MRSGIGNSPSDPLYTASVGANNSIAPSGANSDPVVTSVGTLTGSGGDGASDIGFQLRNYNTGAYGDLYVRTRYWNGSGWDRTKGDLAGAHVKTPPLPKNGSAITAASTTSQQLFAANALRTKLIIQNQDAAINVFVNLGATAVAGAGNLRIAPGGSLELNGTNQTVNLIAASGTPAICAWEF